ncbi:7TM GPCR rhodopsin [Echinococcus multilocularis]|uniref:7TM GPCR rhodopsin n=1 Tax=Echinococcus multilocularis TaxID=6211 RepID=A0A068YG02_ECHMU|nr:7TM GPCR rhodopsin [Echinococcus multilocularis]
MMMYSVTGHLNCANVEQCQSTKISVAVITIPTRSLWIYSCPSSAALLQVGRANVPTHVSCILILLVAIDRYRGVRFLTVFTSASVTSASSRGGGGDNVATGSMSSITPLLLVLLSLLAALSVAYYTILP